jgi:hypothetical protein
MWILDSRLKLWYNEKGRVGVAMVPFALGKRMSAEFTVRIVENEPLK